MSVDDVETEHERFEKAGLKPRKLVEFEKDGAFLLNFSLFKIQMAMK